jgi:hypothetical protein
MGVYIEDDLLYGNAGYLYCLLTVLKETNNERIREIIPKVIKVIV